MRARDALGRLAGLFDARIRRERILLGLTALAVLLLVWEFALRAPLAQRWSRAVEQRVQVESETERLESSVERLQEELAAIEDEEPASPLARARERIAAVDRALDERTRQVISPAEMVVVLRDMVAAEDGLTLTTLRNTGAEAVIASRKGEAAGEEAAAGDAVPRVYRHDVRLVVEGGYFDLLGYLERLEGLRWRFEWRGLRLETVEYPTARLELTLSTLSLDEGWIGV